MTANKDLTVIMLMDFYGQLLTDKQLTALDMYYNQDLSLAEIAEDMEISRQGVRDFIKNGEERLRNFEDKLGLVQRFGEMNRGIGQLRDIVDNSDISYEVKKDMTNILNKLSEDL